MMTSQERNNLGKVLVLTHKAYGKELELDVARMMVDDLCDLRFDKVIDAISAYRKDRKNRFPPLSADLIALANGVVDEVSQALEISGRVTTAVRKHGWSQPEEAAKFIGPIGWNIVKRYGWQHICENLGVNLSETTFTAQVREQILAEIRIDKAGMRDNPALLDYTSTPQIENGKRGLTSAADIMKNILPMPKKESDVPSETE